MKDKTLLIMLALMLVALALRVYRLDFFSLRGDESFTVIFVQRTWEGLWRGISTIEPNPPLMYLALRVWIALAGASEFVTRYFSLWFGVLCVPLIYRLAKEMFGSSSILSGATYSVAESKERGQQTPRATWGLLRFARNDTIGIIAATLMTINPYQIWHSQDVRNYTMWPALSLLALIFFWRWWKHEQPPIDQRRTTKDLIFYVVATLASLYTHYYDVFILAALNLFVFAFTILERRWQTLARWIGAQVVLVLLYAPWILFGTNRITTYGEASAEKSVSLLDVFSRTLAAIIVSETMPAGFRAVVWIPLAFIVAAILFYLAKRHRAPAAFLLLCLVVPTLALYLVSIGRPLFLERYLNGIAPVYYLVFAVGVAGLMQIRLSTMRALALATVALFFVGTSAYATWNANLDPAYAKAPQWRELAQTILSHLQPGDIVVQNFTEMSPFYYLHKDVTVLTLPKDYWFRSSDEQVLRQLNTDNRRIWFVPALPDWWDPDQAVEKYLARTTDRILDTRIDTLRLQLYLTPREFQPKMISTHARIGNATLIGYRVEGDRQLHVALLWRADQRIEKDYTVFVHLADANQRVVAQRDRAPAFGLYPTTLWQPGESIIDAYDLSVDAPGKSTLIVGMYDPATLARVPAFDANGNRLPEDRIVLTQITIP
jgi:uncharacterized membrane protein